MSNEKVNILKVENLKKYFPVTKGLFGKKVGDVKAIDGVSFEVEKGKTFGLVGESGCGKTTTGKSILRIYNPTSGSIIYNDMDIADMSKKEFAKIRRDIALVFQDPFFSLNPRQSVFSMLKEAITLDGKPRTRQQIKDEVNELLRTVELSENMTGRYPHEMSGGQRQRLGIARALACNPKLIVCDEPVSALDVSIQAQIINLLRKLQKERGLSYLFIAHDLSVVRHIADEVAVMYLGRIVEKMESKQLYANPMHPYTRALLSAVPITDYYVEKKRERIPLQGEVPSPINAPSGCTFNPRCKYATDVCRSVIPEFRDMGEGHMVACHNLDKVEK